MKQRTISQMAENADKMKSKLIKVQNTFNTTTASTNNFKTSESSLPKHKRSKTHSNGVDSNDANSSFKSDKTKDIIAQMKSDFQTFYDQKPSRKTVYVNKAQLKKQNKRCSSTGGSKMGAVVFKKKLAVFSKKNNAAISIQNRKYVQKSK